MKLRFMMLATLLFSAGAGAALPGAPKYCYVDTSCSLQQASRCQFKFIECKSTAIGPAQVQICQTGYDACIASVKPQCTRCVYF
jgi:hypothetical protein